MTGYLLDSTTLIDLLQGHPKVSARFARSPEDAEICASIVSQGELMVGVCAPQGLTTTREQFAAEYKRVAQFLAELTAVHPISNRTTVIYGLVQGKLVRQGKRKLTINDGWIAATALEHQLTLVTSDERLKGLGDILRVEDWRV
jgi:predicted nucleic acid-binding protein